MRVVTKQVQLNAFSIPGYALPTFSKGRLKTVYNRWGCVIAQYVIFDELVLDQYGAPVYDLDFNVVYKRNYIRLKSWI
jgi:hypothetical protein